ncbi:MAG: hypothetical protein AAB227_07230 [Pseudomonadota bacterium]
MISDCAADSWANQWAPILFHFQLLGWLLLAAYAATAGVAGRRLFIEAGRVHQDKKAMMFWAVVALLLVILLVNRLFNLQALVTIAARCAAEAEGWYGARRPIQFFLILAASAIAGLVLALALLRRKNWDERLVLAGMAALIAFVAVRSVSFHWVDAYLRLKVFGLNFNGLTEAAALAPVFFGAAWGLRRY